MEGTPIYTPSDQEGSFGTKKKRKGLFESSPDGDAQSLNKSRHIAREALRHEEAKKPAPIFAISESLLRKPVDNSPETEDSSESEVEGLDKAQRQYAAKALRRETRQQRPAVSPEANEPAVLKAGDKFVNEWDDRIEANQDLDEALEEILQEHDIPLELFNDMPVTEAEPDWKPEVPTADQPNFEKTEDTTPREFDNDQVVINTHDTSADQTPAKDTETTVNRFSSENVQDFVPAPANTSQRPVAERRLDDPTPKSVIGSITDYFTQPRSSGNKPDKKSQPARDKLEKQINDLSWELKAKEAKIRQVAAEYVQKKGPSVLETMTPRSSKDAEIKPERRSDEEVDIVETGSGTSYIANRANEYRQRAPEANQLHGAGLKAHEHIGHVLMSGESAKRSKEALGVPKAAQAKEKLQLPLGKRVETLSRPELLAISEQIAVEGSTLRNVYETHLIGEHALRRLVAEYMHDGDVSKALQREIVEHEIDFERDPALRDIAMPAESDDDDDKAKEAKKVAAPGKEALSQLLRKAEAGIDAGSDEDFVYDKAEPKDKTKRPEPKPQGRKRADTVMGAIIIMLIFLIAVLYLWNR
jgi:hypothetical protein